MAIRRSMLIAAAFVFAVLLNVYLFVQGLWSHTSKHGGQLAMADACEPDGATAQQQKVNPNKMLFISCGGFLD